MSSLSTFHLSHNFDVLLPLLGFWSSNFNTFIFPWGMITPTILDVAAITGLSAFGATVHPLKLLEKVNFHHIHARADVTDTGHTTFLMYFFCKYFYGTASAGVVQELQPFIALMTSGSVYAWALYFLVGLYKGIQVMLDQI